MIWPRPGVSPVGPEGREPAVDRLARRDRLRIGRPNGVAVRAEHVNLPALGAGVPVSQKASRRAARLTLHKNLTLTDG